jgi:hypothetical protein
MKKVTPVILIFIFLFSFSSVMSQDMRSFTGKIISTKRVQTKGTEARISQVETKLTFFSSSIEIGTDVYEIVNKEWDEEAITTFTCEKGRGTFDIVFEGKKSVEIRPEEEGAIITRYEELKIE